ncbi:hypothetical protein [Cytobacillus luteolus]|nr:hypothetical protein [Cytobacillus luteolus]
MKVDESGKGDIMKEFKIGNAKFMFVSNLPGFTDKKDEPTVLEFERAIRDCYDRYKNWEQK